MGTVRTNAAAAILGVSPNTLRGWERRFGFPRPRRTAGGHRQFELEELESLRQAFVETHSISSAIGLARQRGAGPSSPARLRGVLMRFDEVQADRILEESLAVRSVERTVEEVLLPAVADMCTDGPPAPELDFAWRWASGWLAAARRVAPAPTRAEAVLLFDASAACDLDGLHIQALDLCLRRAGLPTLTLGVDLATTRLRHALSALDPRAIVVAGRRTSLDALGRLIYAVRRTGTGAPVFDFRGPMPDTGASTVPRLGSDVLAARERLLAWLDRPVSVVSVPAPLPALATA